VLLDSESAARFLFLSSARPATLFTMHTKYIAWNECDLSSALLPELIRAWTSELWGGKVTWVKPARLQADRTTQTLQLGVQPNHSLGNDSAGLQFRAAEGPAPHWAVMVRAALLIDESAEKPLWG
jgi:hypothetical protein